MEFEYKDMKNRKDRDRSSEYLSDLPYYVQSFIIGREGNMSARTQYIYISRIDSFFNYLIDTRFKDKAKADITLQDLDTVTIEDIETFASWVRHGHLRKTKKEIQRKDDKETTVNNYLSALSMFFKYFANRGKLSSNPVAGLERARKKKKEVIRLNKKQKEQFFDCIQSGEKLTETQKRFHDKSGLRDYAICLLLVRTGLRVSELVGLNLRDINFDDYSLTVLRKGDKYDHVFFDDEVAEVLEEYLEERKNIAKEDENGVFVVTVGKYKGSRLSVRSVELLVKKYAVAGPANEQITPHKLRSTYATDMLVATGNISLVQKALNHSSPTTTMVYADQRTIDLSRARNTLKNT